MPAVNKKSFIRYGWHILLAVNALAILLLFMACLSWYISPDTMAVFAYTGLAFPFILLPNAAFAVFWLVCRKWKYLLVTVAALLLCIKPVTAYFPLHMSKKDVPDGCIKLLTYNVRCFNWFPEINSKKKTYGAIEYIRDSGADIVCIQEFYVVSTHNEANLQGLRKRLEQYPYCSVASQRPDYKPFREYGVACFSKYPIIKTEVIPYKSENGSAVFVLDINGKHVSVVNNHLESNGLETKDRELYNDFLKEADKNKINDVTANIRSHLGKAFRKRAAQAEAIDSCIRQQHTDAIIVCGDFNDTPLSYAYHTIKGDLVDSYEENEFGARITYHAAPFLFRIDFIMHSENISSYNCTIDRVAYSDHYPMWAYLKIN
jgi:endonuclease/exonuclease/phosphatase family metal-dependent hydrolase